MDRARPVFALAARLCAALLVALIAGVGTAFALSGPLVSADIQTQLDATVADQTAALAGIPRARYERVLRATLPAGGARSVLSTVSGRKVAAVGGPAGGQTVRRDLSLAGRAYVLSVTAPSAGRTTLALRAGGVLAAVAALLASVPAFFLTGGRSVVRLQRRGAADGHIDVLTGLPTDRVLYEELQRLGSLAARGDRPLACAVFDLDDCAELNERHGHDHTDRLLRSIADTLVAEARDGDRCFRLPGDEFAVLLGDTGLVGGVTAVERVHRRIAAADLGATVSVGVAASTGDGFAGLVDDARAALAEGRSRGQPIATAPADHNARTGPQRRHALQQLLLRGSVDIVFQPIVDLSSGRPLAYEALMRLDGASPFAGPGDAFATAEELGRGHELDALCRRAALDAARQVPGWALLFLNVSPQSFQRRTLNPEALARAVRNAGREPESVVLEITERSVANLELVVATSRRLIELGFRLALDDTGAGNAGLEMLRTLPLDFVKIDQTIVQHARSSRSSRAVLAAILAFAEHRGTEVVAEGVEDEATLAFVRDLGTVRAVQGFHTGRPSRTVVNTPSSLPVV